MRAIGWRANSTEMVAPRMARRWNLPNNARCLAQASRCFSFLRYSIVYVLGDD